MHSASSDAVDNLMFSFLYPNRQQATRCNSKLQQLLQFDIIPELGKSFDQLGLKGIDIELESLEIDLGLLQEEDISIGFGTRISSLLTKALLDAIWEKRHLGNEGLHQNSQVLDLYLLALQMYFLKGYLPIWLKVEFDIYSLLKFVFSNDPTHLKRMLGATIQKSESARKRIAFLETGYFDQLIRVLATTDAEWMISYRNTYLEVHKAKNHLPGPEESLKKSLNLFILTYLAGKSGPKFNRLDFSERFLRSIAAHYNIAFEIFLSEINSIINKISSESNLFREFKETINTINEKNNPDTQWDENSIEPTFLQLVQWLNVGTAIPVFETYLEKWKVSGVLFEMLAIRFPGFWKSLSKNGLFNLLKLLLDDSKSQWLPLTHNYLKWYTQTSPNSNADDGEVLKDVFSLTADNLSLNGLAFQKTDDWFMILSYHAFTELGEHYLVSKSLMALGKKAGISDSGQILLSAKSKAIKSKSDFSGLNGFNEDRLKLSDPRKDDQRKNPLFLKNQLALLVLQQYLNAGMLGFSNRELSQSDLLWIVNNLLQSQDSRLLDALSMANRKNGNAITKRFASIAQGIDRKEFQAFIQRYGAQKTLSLNRFNEKLLKNLGAYPRLEVFLNQKVWELLLEESSTEKLKRSIGFDYRASWEDEAFLSGVFKLTEEKGYRVDALRTALAKLKYKKYVILYFSRNSTEGSPYLSSLKKLALAMFLGSKNQSFLTPVLTAGMSRLFSQGFFALDMGENAALRKKWNADTNKFEIVDGSGKKVDQAIQKGNINLNEQGFVDSNSSRADELNSKSNVDTDKKSFAGSNKRENIDDIEHLNEKSDSQVADDLNLKGKVDPTTQDISETHKNAVNHYIKGISLDQNRLFELLQEESADADFKELILDKGKIKSLKETALNIVEKDMSLLLRLTLKVNLAGYDKKQLLESSKRLMLYSKIEKTAIIRLFKGQKKQLPALLIGLYTHLTKSDWQKFSLWFKLDIVPHIGIENPVLEKLGDVSINLKEFLGALHKNDGLNSAKFSEILEYLQVSNSNATAIGASEALRLPSSLKSIKGLEYLIGLPSSAFFKKSAYRAWRESIFTSIFQFHVLYSSNSSIKMDVFWSIFSSSLRKYRHSLNAASMDWVSILNSKHLDEKAKASLKKSIVQILKKPIGNSPNALETEQLSAAISHLKEEGYLPWWSPIQHKAKLLLAVLNEIQLSNKNDAFLLILLFEKGKTSSLLQDLSENQLKRIYKVVLSSKYKKYYPSFLKAIEMALENYASNTSVLPSPKKENELRHDSIKSPYLFGTTAEAESWVRKKVNSSKENEVISIWFNSSSEVLRNIKTLLAFGSYMYFGNLNPGKWKVWLLVFAYDYYIQKGNRDTESFFGKFLQHLIKNRSEINWKIVFQAMELERRFEGKAMEMYRNEVLKQFPMASEATIQDPEKGELVKISNAGLVLCWPFLSALFSRLNISEKGSIPEVSQSKAVYLLQYIVYGHTDYPEYELVLNKLLVGMKVSQHLERVELQQEEKDMAVSLINGMKSNWEKMKNASADAIRETFLQREGTLEFDSLANTLRIPKTGVDILLDSISWNISMVKLPWMEKSLEIKWR
ncbi:contractile injection system tape measure protein [Mongoliibacter ruber]|uniref:Uncharacterized protein n=1 Tax=Mongoliibacter ruber TaxID=1750599 RepID=A0A2T0WVI9_9BACT|nr:contractile injection system tape measure protein [Mongoliibacter ruber]PRY90708.1 hypothetical protein CLW00_101373 [Mongoliibacter ruber]